MSGKCHVLDAYCPHLGAHLALAALFRDIFVVHFTAGNLMEMESV